MTDSSIPSLIGPCRSIYEKAITRFLVSSPYQHPSNPQKDVSKNDSNYGNYFKPLNGCQFIEL